jgi:DNA-binding IscR family transcriptional regulator
MPAEEISMLQLVDSVDGLSDFQRCPAGMAECNDQQPCGMHENWKALRSEIMRYLEETTIAALAKSMELKRKSVERKAARAKKALSKR